MKALVIYWSATGNTQKVADTIIDTLQSGGVDVTPKRAEEAVDEDLFDYDLVFLGSPTYTWKAADPVLEYIKTKRAYYRERGVEKLGSPRLPAKRAVVFVTYSGPHTGLNEAIPVGKYMGQFLDHLGFEIAGEWYTVGEFHNNEETSTKGRLGDIRGRPNRQDLVEIVNGVKGLLKT